MNEQIQNNAWSMYWQQNQLHSCLENGDGDEQSVLELVWKRLADSLKGEAKILDLATGNGIVPSILLNYSPELKIEAVDKAKISPNQHYKSNPQLRKVIFRGGIDIAKLPFLPNTFDAITSQFGIEYAGLLSATNAVIPFLKKNGMLTFVVHHRQSEIIKGSISKILEISELTKENGLINSFSEYLEGIIGLTELEAAGQTFIDSRCKKSEQITGQIFSIIEQSIKSNSEGVINTQLAKNLRLQLGGQQQRLKQLLDAAQNQEQMESYKNELVTKGFIVETCEPVYANHEQKKELIAWYIRAIKQNKN